MSETDTNYIETWITKIGMAQGIIGMVLNTLAWLVILRTKSLHNRTNYLLAYLAVVDSLACFHLFGVSATNGILFPIGSIGRELHCRLIFSGFTGLLVIYCSTYGLCVVTYERYIGIVYPLQCPRLLSAGRVIKIVSITWTMAFLFTCPSIFAVTASTKEDPIEVCDITLPALLTLVHIDPFVFGYLCPILFMSWAYYKIQATLKRGAQQLQQQNAQGAALELLQARRRVVKMLMFVMGALLVLCIPFYVKHFFCLSNPTNIDWCYSATGFSLQYVLSLMYHMNYVINPIIYVFQYKKFRKGLQDMLCSCLGGSLRPNHIGFQINVINQPFKHTR